MALIGREIVGAGGSVVLSSRGALVAENVFRAAAFGSAAEVQPTIAHGQRFTVPGWHVMRMPGTDWMETATGFGAGGVQQILAHVAGGTLSAQRFVPVVEFSSDPPTVAKYGDDLDAVALGDAAEQARVGLDVDRRRRESPANPQGSCLRQRRLPDHPRPPRHLDVAGPPDAPQTLRCERQNLMHLVRFQLPGRPPQAGVRTGDTVAPVRGVTRIAELLRLPVEELRTALAPDNSATRSR